MSIFLLASDTAQRMPAGPGGAPPPAPPAVPGAPGPPPAGALASAITALTAFIPAETITLFVAVTGIIAGWTFPDLPARNEAFFSTI